MSVCQTCVCVCIGAAYSVSFVREYFARAHVATCVSYVWYAISVRTRKSLQCFAYFLYSCAVKVYVCVSDQLVHRHIYIRII